MPAGRSQLFVASTLYGVATLAAAIDDGQFASADQRLLVISNNTATPELTPSAAELPGFGRLSRRFDRVVFYNEAIEPLHPSGWAPPAAERPLLERMFRSLWQLGDHEIRLVLESIQVEPARALAGIFGEATIDVYADGLMSFGPTRNPLDPSIGSRIERLLYVDLVPGLRPLLLSEWGVRPIALDDAALRSVIKEASADTAIGCHSPEPVAIILGQYLSALSIMSAAEEEQLHVEMLTALVDRGERNIIFKPHPSSPHHLGDRLHEAADQAGVRFQVLAQPVLAETLYERLGVSAVIGCFSTGLLTASAIYRLPAYRVGTAELLATLTPFHNSNRIPAVLVDRLLPAPADPPPLRDTHVLAELIAALGYVMQPLIYPELRERTIAFCRDRLEERERYFRRRRLTRLDLPGRLPAKAKRLSGSVLPRRLLRLIGDRSTPALSSRAAPRVSSARH